jgi:hypothetical protein
MKIQRLIDILEKAKDQFNDQTVTFEDGYISIDLDDVPEQNQIDAVPTSEYDECIASPKHIYRFLRIWGD